MIAAYALLCLALPHVIVGSIFEQRPKYSQMKRVIIQPLNFIDQKQPPRYQPGQDTVYSTSNENSQETTGDISSYMKKYVEVLKFDPQQQHNIQQLNDNKQSPQLKYYYQNSQEQRNSQEHRNSQEQRNSQELKYDHQRYNQVRDSQEQQHRFNKRNNVNQQSLYKQEQRYNTQPQTYKQQIHSKEQKHQIYDDSQEVHQQTNSQEQRQVYEKRNIYQSNSQENSQEQYKYNQKLNQGKINKYISYGDAIQWNGLKMAVGPNSPVHEEADIKNIFNEAYSTMPHANEEQKMKYNQAFTVAAQQENEDVYLNTTELLKKNQYPVETHTVKTEDGYILTLVRIPPKKVTRDVQKRPVVFLMHGLLGSSDDWVLLGPGKALAYLLSDAGYDVWLGNARGNKYSRRHVSKHPTLPEFWQFSIDEIALQDLPAMIDYALQTSQQQRLYYIGHSQGTTAFFALAATRPEYNDKIISMYALSPMAYMTHVRSPLVRMIAPNSAFSDRLQNLLGNGEFHPSKELLSTVGGEMLKQATGNKNVSRNAYFVMSGVNMEQLDEKLIPVIMSHLPAGASTRQIKHFGQGVASRQFRMYDHGAQMNEKVYGTQEPPQYQLSAVMTPVELYYSERDWMTHPTDVERLRKELPTVTDYYKVPVEQFNSVDFQLAKIAPEAVYKRIIDSIQKKTTY